MISIESFGMLNRHVAGNDENEHSRYPDPPQAFFSSAPMDMGLTTEATAFSPFVAASTAQETFPTPMAYDHSSLYPETPNYVYNNRSSPGGPFDDGDMRAGSSNLSTTSAPSAASSAVGSPQSNHGQLAPIPEWAPQTLSVSPNIVGHNDYFPTGSEYSAYGPGMEDFAPFDFSSGTKPPGFVVDPSLIHPDISRPMQMAFEGPFQTPTNVYPNSPALSHGASSPQPMLRNGSQSPFLHGGFQQPYSPYAAQTPMDTTHSRRPSHPFVSPNYSEATPFSSDESKEKSRCPHADCGKAFKDLKAHMLTHQNERPEKCPIQTCDYHIKGFSRKYDRNRHTLTHYKGTMVCGFCPGSGSAAEKSFNRADVFKRHLTAVHGVEQTPPNSRKKAPTTVSSGAKRLSGYPPDATGKCSTCSQTFGNAQDFYEHLDDCVLRIVQQEDPAEAVNAKRLAEVENDREVMQTLEKNNLPLSTSPAPGVEDAEEEDDEEMHHDDDDEEDESPFKRNSITKRKSSGNPVNGVQKSRGMTHSRGGVLLNGRRGRKNRRDYPSSWGFDKGQMTMKKRVMAVFEGPRRLAKDDMMLSTEHEVRVRLSDGDNSYVTDLDVQTLKRAQGFLHATDEEKGPWISDDPTDEELKQMREMLGTSLQA
ncbi:hypothetical protein jhhlp_001826 [Lomentospora prolificans]|uniref:C2H2-type domain-containing protein n=1 Tax=Lomentospora prolificans TaxID=41688 RepID=A0A2N3NGW5_9PEZI|nr:hypothetical protein jhhlp_001826 [Lomentospora prolificans]